MGRGVILGDWTHRRGDAGGTRAVSADAIKAKPEICWTWRPEHGGRVDQVRIAGESFSLITGLDLAWNNLEIKPPEDTAEDDDIAADEDYGLPWPDASKLGEWWRANAMRFPPGRRFFMGETPSAGHAGNVLRQGTQRQRIAAARWRCLLEPGTPLFNASAPAWRQQRWLGAAPH